MTKTNLKKNFTEGPIFTRIIAFAIPLILTGFLQLVYGMADTIVVGRFSGDGDALAAVGSTSTLTALWVNLMVAISSGAGILVAHFYGAKDDRAVSRTSHTSMMFAIVVGLASMVVALVTASPVLKLMGTDSEYFNKSLIYTLIIFIGLPADSVYNFGASVLRSVGDSKTTLYSLAASGIVNVLLNLLFVVAFKWSIVGVAVATLIAKYMSAAWASIVLLKRKNQNYGITVRNLRIDGAVLRRILQYGIPILIQSLLFNLAALVVTASANTFPQHVIDARTIAGTIDQINYSAMHCFSVATMTFLGQNYGARRARRMNKVFLYTLIQITFIGIFIGQLIILFEEQIAGWFMGAEIENKEMVIGAVKEINSVLLNFYFTCGILEVLSGALKALGASVLSVIGCSIGVAARVSWLIFFVPMKRFHTPENLYMAYIISWVVSIVILSAFCLYIWKKLGIFKLAREEKKLEKEKMKVED